MADKEPVGSKKDKAQAQLERQDRLSRALRENLAKRKAQSRARATDEQDKKGSS